MTAIAIIPARGGSKGVLRKNLASVGGVQLITRAVRACRRSQYVDRVVVTSDNHVILATATHAGAEVIERPAVLATDEATSESAVRHAIGQGLQADYLALVQCTSPFLTPEHIDRCFGALERHSAADMAMLAARCETVIWRGGERQQCVTHLDGILRGRRQDAAPVWGETGACYVYRWAAFVAHGDRIREAQTVIVEVPYWPYSLQIDTPDDLRAADMLASEWGLW